MKVLRPTRTKLTQGYKSSHKGYDTSGYTPLPGLEFDPHVYASFDGIVVLSVNKYKTAWRNRGKLTTRDYGNFVKIRGNKLFQLSAHLQYGSVIPVGTRVKEGDVIGIIGHTGNSTGRHNHTEYRFLNNRNTPVEFYQHDIIKPSPIETPMDIRIKLLNEYRGTDELKQLKTEGELREGLERIRRYKQLQNDRQNANKKIKDLEQALERAKNDFKIEATSNKIKLQAEKDERTRIIKEVAGSLGSTQDLPSILTEISNLKGKEERFDALERKNKALNEEISKKALEAGKLLDKLVDTKRQLNSIKKELETALALNKDLRELSIKNPMKRISRKGQLIKQDWIKIGKGALLAGLVPATLYLLDWLQTIDFGNAWWAPIAAGLVPVIVNTVRKYVKESRY